MRGPPTIAGFVITIVIDAIYGVPLAWSRPHVGVEVFKFEPSLANRNAASPIIAVFAAVWIAASLFHRVPYFVLWGAGHSMRGVFWSVVTTAAAGVRVAVANVQNPGAVLVSTLALKPPMDVFADARGGFYCNETAKSLA